MLHFLAYKVIQLAMEKNLTLCTAESLTGGMIAARLTGIPGASRVLLGGIVSYSAHVKHMLLEVTQDAINCCEAVNETCAKQMAQGAKARLGADIAISCTGLAGPGGGTEQTPVGTVFLSVASEKRLKTLKVRFPGGRSMVRRRTTATALNLLLDEISAW